MTVVTMFAVLLAAVLTAAAGHAGQLHLRRRAGTREADRARREEWERAEHRARERRQAAIRDHPDRFLDLVTRRLQVDLVGPQSDLDAADERLAVAQAALETAPEPRHGGVALLARIVATAALAVLVGLAAVLNVEIFVAVNNGALAAAPVAKGVGATALEVLLIVYLAESLHRRRFESLLSKLLAASALGILFAVVAGVGSYAPARSEIAYAEAVAVARRTVVVNDATVAARPTVVNRAAADAAHHGYDEALRRLERGRESDVVQAVSFPLGEALVGHFALSGVAAVVDRRRRRGRLRDVARAKRARRSAQAEVDRRRRRAEADAAEVLFSAGILTPDAVGPAPLPDRLAAAAPPARPTSPPDTVDPDAVAPDVVDLRDFPRPTDPLAPGPLAPGPLAPGGLDPFDL